MEQAQVTDRVLVKIVLTAAVAVAGVGFTLFGDRPAPAYFFVDALHTSGLGTHEGEELRVHGFVVPGSIHEFTTDPNQHSFLLTSEGKKLRVIHGGTLPDVFRDHAEAIVTGELAHRDGDWVIDATQISTKCTGKYDGGSASVSDAVKFK